jgi:hypothetical protein
MSDERRVAERRTLALRGPGAGGFTPAQSVAASNPCLNCGTNIQLEYCPECGQREIDPDPTLKEFLHELAEEFLHWDGKLLTTFRLLVTQPGELTREYLAGRRVRFISPLRVYLTCSLLYFFCAAVVPERQLRVVSTRSRTTRVGVVNIGTSDTVKALAELDSMAAGNGMISRAWGAHFGRAMRDRETLSRRVFYAVPKAMFVLLPTFAALFALAFRDRRRLYPQHLAFALHIHAVIFLGMIVMLLGRFGATAMIRTPVNLVVGGLLGAYLLSATNKVYGGATAGTLARLLLVFALYGVAFVAAMFAIFVIVVLTT